MPSLQSLILLYLLLQCTVSCTVTAASSGSNKEIPLPLSSSSIKTQTPPIATTITTSGYNSQQHAEEERWVAEEEFYGASNKSSQQKKRISKKKEQQIVKDPGSVISSYPGHENIIGEQSTTTWWDDEKADDGSDEDDVERLTMQPTDPSILTKKKRRRKHRLRVWKNGKMRKGIIKSTPTSTTSGDDSSNSDETIKPSSSSCSSSTISEDSYDEEHPLRTDEWQLNIQLSRFYPRGEGDLFPECYDDSNTNAFPGEARVPVAADRKKSSSNMRYRKCQVMQFARNGYVKIISNHDDHYDKQSTSNNRRIKPRVGKWRIGHSGVAFDIPIQVVAGTTTSTRKKLQQNEATNGVTVLHYHADIHLNKFGERPRMFKGVITRDR